MFEEINTLLGIFTSLIADLLTLDIVKVLLLSCLIVYLIYGILSFFIERRI